MVRAFYRFEINYNEGWNVYITQAAMQHRRLVLLRSMAGPGQLSIPFVLLGWICVAFYRRLPIDGSFDFSRRASRLVRSGRAHCQEVDRRLGACGFCRRVLSRPLLLTNAESTWGWTIRKCSPIHFSFLACGSIWRLLRARCGSRGSRLFLFWEVTLSTISSQLPFRYSPTFSQPPRAKQFDSWSSESFSWPCRSQSTCWSAVHPSFLTCWLQDLIHL